MRKSGYRFAHPGYARYELLSIRLFTLSKSIRNVLLTLISDVPANVAKAANLFSTSGFDQSKSLELIT